LLFASLLLMHTGGTAALIEQLEAAAEVAGGGLGTSELGSRTVSKK
jgi:hypothetical protein